MMTEMSSQMSRPTGEWDAEWFGKTLELLSQCETLSTEDRCAILASLAEVGSDLLRIDDNRTTDGGVVVIGMPMEMMHLIVSALVRLVAEGLMFPGEIPRRDAVILNIKTVFDALKTTHGEES